MYSLQREFKVRNEWETNYVLYCNNIWLRICLIILEKLIQLIRQNQHKIRKNRNLASLTMNVHVTDKNFHLHSSASYSTSPIVIGTSLQRSTFLFCSPRLQNCPILGPMNLDLNNKRLWILNLIFKITCQGASDPWNSDQCTIWGEMNTGP